MPDKVWVYRDESAHWRWRRIAPNGRTIASSGESFSSKRSATRAARRANSDADLKVGIVARVVRAVRR